MNAPTCYKDGEVLVEGKTKVVKEIVGQPALVAMISKDSITAGDGAKQDLITGKGSLANETTCNVFRLLKSSGLVPLAFVTQDGQATFIAKKCRMLPYEVVVRREGHGSYLKRHPYMQKGQLFPKLLVEFFLKTSGKEWKGKPLLADDPLMQVASPKTAFNLYDPAKPLAGQEPFLTLSADEVFDGKGKWEHFPKMAKYARRTFLLLEKAWQLQGRTLVDFKVEFGLDNQDNLLLADVIDNDSWRVVENGAYIDKQVYRDGGELSDVAEKYRRVAEVTSHFRLPKQQVVLWRGSKSDDFKPFLDALAPFREGSGLHVREVTCSVHKEPLQASSLLHECVQKVPDSVVIAYVGRSNGAGPTLSAMSTVPVITVPASVKDFPDDVWSSLRAPSNVPVMTVLEPANAVLAAMQFLSARDPVIYTLFREGVEERLQNTLQIS